MVVVEPKAVEDIRPIQTHLPSAVMKCLQPQFVNELPSRSVNRIPDSKIVIRSDFCSGNLSRAYRGANKNQFDLWVA